MKADLLIHSATIFDGRGLNDQSTAIAVVGGRIIAVGNDADIATVVDGAREVVNAHGALVTPSFIDSHVHPVMGGFERLRCDLTAAADAEQTLQMIADYACAHPEAEWLIGGGWRTAYFLDGPKAQMLDQITGGRPVFLANADHHAVWVSSEVIRRAGITDLTPDPLNGRIDRDASGHPTGTFQESGMEMFSHLLPPADVADYVEALYAAQQFLTTFGVTGWQDAIVGEYGGFGDSSDAYRFAHEHGLLTARITGALWLERGLGVANTRDVTDRMIERRAHFEGSGLRATSVKIMQDGVVEARTAAMKGPYLDHCGHASQSCGDSHFSPEVLNSIVPSLVKAGFQVHAHAIGDRALAEILDSLAAARRAGDDGRMRHHVAHVQQVDPVDIARMADLGITANIQGLWACNEPHLADATRDAVGWYRYGGHYPFADLQAARIGLAMGSDWPVSSPDPWQAIHVAVTRQVPGDLDSPPLCLEQALTLQQALAAYTSGSARVTHQDRCGRIAVGMNADLAIADRNPFALPAAEIHTVRNRLTFLAGRIAYEAPRTE